MARKTNYTKNGQEYCRVTKSYGRGSDGKPIRKEFYGKTKKEAEEKRDEYTESYKKGLIQDKNALLGPTMYIWLFEVLRVSEDIKPGTFERYEGIYRNYVKGEILELEDGEVGDLYLCNIRTLQSIEIQRYYNKLYEVYGKTSNEIKNLHKLLRNFLNYAVDEGYLGNNPCSKTRRRRIAIPGDAERKGQEQEIEVFTDEELTAFQTEITKHQYEALFLLALGTGMREGELLALNDDEIDFKTHQVKVDETMRKRNVFNADGSKEYKLVKGVTKNRKSRLVPFPSKITKKLKAYISQKKKEKIRAGSAYQNGEYFFLNSLGGPIDERNLLRSYARVLKRAGIPYRKFHALRHTYATKLIEAGVPLKVVQILLGHTNPNTTNIYTHVVPKKKMEAAEKLNDLFL